MKIKNMRKPNEEGQWGKVKAFFDVENSGFEMKGFRIVEGINGLFVSVPSRKGTDDEGNDKWFDTIWIESREIREKLNTHAIEEYNNDSTASSDNTNPEAMSEETTTGDNIKEETNDSTASSDNTNPEAMSEETTTGENIKEETPSTDAANDSNVPAFSDDDIPF